MLRVRDSQSVAQTGLPGAAGLEKHVLYVRNTKRQKTKPCILVSEAREGGENAWEPGSICILRLGTCWGQPPGQLALLLRIRDQGSAREHPVLVPSWPAFLIQSSPRHHLPPPTLGC